MNNEDPLLLEHEADGIRELDNKLPRWWVWLFYGTTIFAVVYLLYYHVFHAGNLMAAEYKKEFAAGEALKARAMAKFDAEIATLEPSQDAVVLSRGQDTFRRLCAPCHRVDGGGVVGPNLTDDYWIHGPKFSDNLKTIWNGVPEKGMITWKNSLKPKDVYEVASYIYTLRGTKPPNPKPPENQVPVKTGPSEFE
ncbi:MAG TPA: cbb3-type cytochrome c oxidase N-terminal domain-containing protein [Candidatus Dormibacteraeota bacterium]|nr:cbb3-type cytochrome c oxidase N-terminal domain-containing protein [Candidatus Dormibacteraeota bacterium]